MLTSATVENPQSIQMNDINSNGKAEILEIVSIPFNPLIHEKQEASDKVKGRNNRKRNDLSELEWLNKQISEVWEND